MLHIVQITLTALFLLSSGVAGAEIWKCTDPDGNTRYENDKEKAKGCTPLNLDPLNIEPRKTAPRKTTPPIDYWKKLGDAIGGLKDKPLSLAMERLSYPTREQNIAGKKFIVWESVGASCRVTIEVDSKNIVRGTEIEGNQAACVNWGRIRKLI